MRRSVRASDLVNDSMFNTIIRGSFGQVLGHVSSNNNLLCKLANNMKNLSTTFD